MGDGAGLERHGRVSAERVSGVGSCFGAPGYGHGADVRRQRVRRQSESVVDGATELRGDARGDGEDAMGGEVAAEDGEE